MIRCKVDLARFRVETREVLSWRFNFSIASFQSRISGWVGKTCGLPSSFQIYDGEFVGEHLPAVLQQRGEQCRFARAGISGEEDGAPPSLRARAVRAKQSRLEGFQDSQ